MTCDLASGERGLNMKRTGFDHPKIRRLGRLLDLPHYAAVGIMESLWHFTARHAIEGDIGKWSDEEIADAIGWPEDSAEGLVEALVRVRLVDRDDDHRLVIHDWHDHADDSTKKTLKKHGREFVTQKVATVPEDSRTVPEDSGIDTERSGDVTEHGGNVPDSHSHSHSHSHCRSHIDETRRDDHLYSSSKEKAEFVDKVEQCAKRTFGAKVKRLDSNQPVFPDKDRHRPDNRDLLLKLAVLMVTGKIEEACILDAVEAVKRREKPPNNPVAYLQECIAEWRTQRQIDPLGKLLIGVEAPVELLETKGAAA